MNIKTTSIIDIIEMSLNKTFDNITIDDLDKIKYLMINRIDYDDVLDVDSNDLKLFKNLEELSINNCMIDVEFINNIKSLEKLNKISFINCDFVDDASDYFNNLIINELVLDSNLGINNITFSNIHKLVLINCTFNCIINNIDILDITRSKDINIDLEKSNYEELIISREHDIDNYLFIKSKVVIKNEYDEEVKVIDNV